MPKTETGRNFFRRSFDAFIAARERQAEMHVNRVLLTLDDEALRLRGYNRKDLERRANSWL